MKTLFISLFTILALTVIISSGIFWMRKNQVRADQEIIRLNKVADSLNRVQLQKDSIIIEWRKIIEAQSLVIESREMEIRVNREKSNKIRHQYESYIFRNFANDSVRLRELARHFPSLGNR